MHAAGRPCRAAAAAVARCLPAYRLRVAVAPRSPVSSGVGGPCALATATAAAPKRRQGSHCAQQQRTLARAYKDPEVYDIAFNFRNFEQEAAHLLAMYQKHSQGAMQHFLEVACGPARHARMLVSAAGARATALDVSAGMLQYAQQQAEVAGVADKMQFVQADMMQEGWAQQVEPPADLAAVLLGSLAHCLSNDAALRCFTELSKAVRPGGLLVLELPHPAVLFGGYCLEEEKYVEVWDAQNEDGSKTVLVEWGREGDHFDLQPQVFHRTVGLSLYVGDELASSEVETVPQRQYTLQEIDLLARATGFEVVDAHGDFDVTIPLDDEEAYRSIVCLRRLPAA